METFPILSRMLACRMAAALSSVVVASAAGALVIDNGSAPPDPNNIFTGGDSDLTIRDAGCAGEPIPCPSPGPPTTVEVQAGLVQLSVLDSSRGIVTSGSSDAADVQNAASLELSGGFVDSISGRDVAQILLFSGGTSEIQGSVTLFGAASFEMQGGFVEGVLLRGSSSAHILGGVIGDSSLGVTENATAQIEGGQIGSGFSTFFADDDAVATWSGGSIQGAISAEGNSVIEIVGSNFAVNGTPVGLGPLSATSGVLTGDLHAGGSVNNNFFQQTAGSTGVIVLLPEPAFGWLWSSGVLLLAVLRTVRQRGSGCRNAHP